MAWRMRADVVDCWQQQPWANVNSEARWEDASESDEWGVCEWDDDGWSGAQAAG